MREAQVSVQPLGYLFRIEEVLDNLSELQVRMRICRSTADTKTSYGDLLVCLVVPRSSLMASSILFLFAL